MASSTGNADYVEKWSNKFLQEFELTILEKFPEKLMKLETLLSGEKYSYNRLPEVLPDIDGLFALMNSLQAVPPIGGNENWRVQGMVTINCNKALVEMSDEVRPILREAEEHMKCVRRWIGLLLPKAEAGDNFGVCIQEECVKEALKYEEKIANFLKDMRKERLDRADIIGKIARHPNIVDYRKALLEIDEEHFKNIRLVLVETLNQYALIYDIITKNMDKIKNPRTVHTNMIS